ncbi:asparagine synthase-related protein [Anderseniella sp. Alg231-50]|uniref:asparagine synthase-related protein n=1 Tax=Anderseniella sp. Alg231-50 TaxID=1922226 RepID=UPI000D557B66
MSGIGAIFWKDGRPAERAVIERLGQGLRPYGRTAQTVRTSGSCGVVFALRGTTGMDDKASQPLQANDGRHLFVFDGRLANRAEIARDLGGSSFRSDRVSDADLAFQSWLMGGDAAVKKWSGEFSFICWDAHEETLLACRDHIGLRALCYHETPQRVVVASAPRAVLSLPDVERAIDEQKIADQLVQLFHDGERTYYKDIRRVLPGHLFRVSPAKTESTRYWSLDEVPDVRYARDEDYVEAGLELFNEAVRSQVAGEPRVGTFLSGGLDSSSVAVTALDHLSDNQALPAFTWVPSRDWDGRCRDGSYGDETPFIEDICNLHPRIKPHFVRSEGHGLFHQLDDFLDYSGVAPRNAINLCWIHDINMAARDQGLNVLLDGGMGNMSLSWSGEGVLLERWQNGDYANLLRDVFAGPGGAKGVYRRLTHMLLFRIAPDWVHRRYAQLRGDRGSLPLWRRRSVINPDFAREMHVEDRMAHYGWDFFSTPVRDTRRVRGELFTGSFSHERADIHQALRAMYNVETRDPFSDRRLIEWSLGLPEAQSRRFGQNRWMIRRMMQDKLPASVLDNPGGGEQVIDWHARLTWDLPRLREELEALSDDPDTARFIDVKLIQAYLDDWPAETPFGSKDRGYAFIPVGICSAIAAGRLVRRTKGSNR